MNQVGYGQEKISMGFQQDIHALILDVLDGIKAKDVVSLDVREKTDMFAYIVVASADSCRHVHAMARHLEKNAKSMGFPILGVEGRSQDEWVLVDFGDIVVHLMHRQIREYYDLESLWQEKCLTKQIK